MTNFSTSDYGAEAGSQLYRYQLGNALYLGLLRNPPGINAPGHDHGDRDIELFKLVEFAIGLPRKKHLYNMRTDGYLSRDDQAQYTQGDVTPFMPTGQIPQVCMSCMCNFLIRLDSRSPGSREHCGRGR